MKEQNDVLPCCEQPATSEWYRPQRGDLYYYLSNSLFDISRTQWDADPMDEARRRVGNVFDTEVKAAQARGGIKKYLAHFARDQTT